jgi:hypothetical protein
MQAHKGHHDVMVVFGDCYVQMQFYWECGGGE